MNVARRPDGQWRARYRDEDHKEHARHFRRKVDAQRWLDEVTTSKVTGTYVDPKAGAVLLSVFFEEWSARQVWATGTRRTADLAVGSFPDRALKSIRRSHVEAWVKGMADRGLAPTTVQMRMKYLRMVFRAAVRDRLIPTDPSEGVQTPRRRRREVTMRIPTPEEVGALLRASEKRRAFIAVCAFAGLRLGEAGALRVEDIDMVENTIDVRRQAQRVPGGGVEVVRPKAGSERSVFIPQQLADILEADLKATGRSEWVFGDDRPPNANTVNHWWRGLLAKTGLDFRMHDLRHFYASGLISEGCDVVTVQKSLGHASATTTLDTYSHLWPTAEDRTRAALSRLLADSLRTDEDEQASDLR